MQFDYCNYSWVRLVFFYCWVVFCLIYFWSTLIYSILVNCFFNLANKMVCRCCCWLVVNRRIPWTSSLMALAMFDDDERNHNTWRIALLSSQRTYLTGMDKQRLFLIIYRVTGSTIIKFSVVCLTNLSGLSRVQSSTGLLALGMDIVQSFSTPR